MIYRGFGQRRDGEGEQPAVAIFVHDLLQKRGRREERRGHRRVRRLTKLRLLAP